MEGRLANTQQAIIRVQGEIRVAQAALDRQQALLNDRARVAYENGPGSSLEFLLGSTSVADLTDRLEIVNSIAERDDAIINSIRNEEANLHIKRTQLSELQAKLLTDRAELVSQQQALQQKLDQAKQILAGVEQDKKEVQTLVADLGKKLEAERAAAAAAALAAQSRSGDGSAIKGVFSVCPVDQPHGYGDDFGAPRYSGGYHLHAGNDIFAPLGTPIRAPFAGTASNATNGLGGLSVYVTGSLGYVYNAHLSSIGTLGPVSAGTIVGYVGNSGDAQGGPTHDHFEWHPPKLDRPLS